MQDILERLRAGETMEDIMDDIAREANEAEAKYKEELASVKDYQGQSYNMDKIVLNNFMGGTLSEEDIVEILLYYLGNRRTFEKSERKKFDTLKEVYLANVKSMISLGEKYLDSTLPKWLEEWFQF